LLLTQPCSFHLTPVIALRREWLWRPAIFLYSMVQGYRQLLRCSVSRCYDHVLHSATRESIEITRAQVPDLAIDVWINHSYFNNSNTGHRIQMLAKP
jgi:hypothetical protein